MNCLRQRDKVDAIATCNWKPPWSSGMIKLTCKRRENIIQSYKSSDNGLWQSNEIKIATAATG
eukprot:4193648-Ditylum_brightwellii.AAC.1